jgi:hypothetical protein
MQRMLRGFDVNGRGKWVSCRGRTELCLKSAERGKEGVFSHWARGVVENHIQLMVSTVVVLTTVPVELRVANFNLRFEPLCCVHCHKWMRGNRSEAEVTELRNSYNIYRMWGSHSGGYEQNYLLGYNAVWSVESQPTLRRNISPPSSEAKNKQSKIEAICSSETSGDFQRTTRRYIPEDSTLRIILGDVEDRQ